MNPDKYFIQYDWRQGPTGVWGYFKNYGTNWLIAFVVVWIFVHMCYRIYDIGVRRAV